LTAADWTEDLLVNEGWDVTALHRPTSNITYLKRVPIKLAEGSITDRELDYRFQPMTVAVQDNYDWLVKEGLLAKSG